MKYIVTWYDNEGYQTKEFADLYDADNWAANRSAKFGWARLNGNPQRWYYKEYQHGVQVKVEIN